METRGKHGNHVRANRQHRWTEKKIIASTGYVKLRVGRGHPLSDPNGYAYEHLVVWCSAGNNRPDKGFLLHHKNSIKSDNRIENLEIISRSSHSRLHTPPRDPKTGRMIRTAGALLDQREWREFPV